MTLSLLILIIALIVYLVIMVGLLSLLIQSLTEPPFAPTFNRKVPGILSEILSANPEIKFFVEPGCGLANISRAVKLANPKLEVWAVEKSWFVYSVAWLWNQTLPKAKRLNLICGDSLKFDQQKLQNQRQGLVYSYLLPEFLTKIYAKSQFSNCLVVSLDFQIQNLKPTETMQMSNSKIQYKLFLYDLR